jgi:hypothetical protein
MEIYIVSVRFIYDDNESKAPQIRNPRALDDITRKSIIPASILSEEKPRMHTG